MDVNLRLTDEILLEEELMSIQQITHGDENVDLAIMLRRFIRRYGINVWFDGKHWKANHVGGKPEDQQIFATRSEAYQFVIDCIVNSATGILDDAS